MHQKDRFQIALPPARDLAASSARGPVVTGRHDGRPAFSHQAQGLRIKPVLDLQHPPREGLLRVAFDDRNRILRHDRSRIHLRHDEVYGRTVPLHAGFKRPTMGVKPLELRQQRRMNVEQATAPAPDEPRRQQPHEAGQAYEIDPLRLKLRVQRALESFAVLRERPVIDDCRRDARVARAGKTGRELNLAPLK